MPITRSEIIEDAVQKDGRRHITECHTDHLGVRHCVRYVAVAGMDVQAAAAARVPQLDAMLLEVEMEANKGEVLG